LKPVCTYGNKNLPVRREGNVVGGTETSLRMRGLRGKELLCEKGLEGSEECRPWRWAPVVAAQETGAVDDQKKQTKRRPGCRHQRAKITGDYLRKSKTDVIWGICVKACK